MEVTVYLDVLFFINAFLDYLLLSCTGLILKKPIRLWRSLLSAALGGLYSLSVFFLPNLPLGGVGARLFAGALMVFFCFRPGSFRSFIQYICIFLAFSCLSAGAAFAFFFRCGTKFGAVYHNGVFYLNFPIFLLLFFFFLCYVLLTITFSLGHHFAPLHKKIFTLRVHYQNKSLLLSGLYDSGNLLTDDSMGKGVIIAEWKALEKLFPKQSFKSLQNEDFFHFFPYETLQGSALLPAFLPDKIFVKRGRNFVEIEPVFIGLTPKTLDRYHHWDAILPQDFKGVTSNETVLAEKLF